MNPAEVFGDSVTEQSYVECCASCISALATFHGRNPHVLADRVSESIERAARWLEGQQNPDGTWDGAWGVSYIYGTLFGVRGLMAAGRSAHDPSIRRACAWLRGRQKPDGSWGEHYETCVTGRYREHPEGQVIQTAWALSALLYAEEPDLGVLGRGALWLARQQDEAGRWPRQEMAGVFFHTALLDYTMYRSYFPIWALGMYETRRKADRGRHAQTASKAAAPRGRTGGRPALRVQGT
jgi:lanosterol synthase